MKTYSEPLQATSTGAGPTLQPVQLTWRGKSYAVVEVLERWRWRQLWWLDEQARSYFRVTVRSAHQGHEAEWEVYESGGQWVLVAIYD